METRRGGVGWGKPKEFNTVMCICPTQGHSLRITLVGYPGGLPAEEVAGLRGQPTAPPLPFPAGRSPFPASGCGPELSPNQVGLPDTRFRRPTPLSAQIPRLLTLQPPGLPSMSPSSLRTLLATPPAPSPVGGPGRRSFPPSRRLSSGAHLARPPTPARLLSKLPPPKSSRPRPVPGRIQFEAPQDLPGTLVLG